ncbi:dual OB domain-containing protein [Persephonella sp.]
MKKKILLLANSVKRGQRCIAGIDVENREWIRFVKDRNGKELLLSDFEIVDKDNEKIHNNVFILSLLEVEIKEKVPLNHQKENCIIDSKIVFIENYPKSKLEEFVQYPKDLWGRDNKVSLTEIDKNNVDSSLFLIKVDKVELYLKDRSEWGQSPQRRARFLYNNIDYDFPLTDPKYERLEKKIIENVYLVISLGEPWEDGDGYCYKLVAGVIS